VLDLLLAVTSSSGAQAANPTRDPKLDPWDLALDEDPDPISAALEAIADFERELFASYPRELPPLSLWRNTWRALGVGKQT
jgi:hypothetical protein